MIKPEKHMFRTADTLVLLRQNVTFDNYSPFINNLWKWIIQFNLGFTEAKCYSW